MKIRADFVTNSSSTSFIIITDEELNRDDFLNKIGVLEESEFSFLFENLYDALNRNKVPLNEYIEKELDEKDNIYEYFKNKYSEDIAEKINLSYKQGKKVWIGELSSDYDEYETFFCTDSFIVDEEEIYINGANCVW